MYRAKEELVVELDAAARVVWGSLSRGVFPACDCD